LLAAAFEGKILRQDRPGATIANLVDQEHPLFFSCVGALYFSQLVLPAED
jgi:hypothetical protein